MGIVPLFSHDQPFIALWDGEGCPITFGVIFFNARLLSDPVRFPIIPPRLQGIHSRTCLKIFFKSLWFDGGNCTLGPLRRDITLHIDHSPHKSPIWTQLTSQWSTKRVHWFRAFGSPLECPRLEPFGSSSVPRFFVRFDSPTSADESLLRR